MYVTQVFVEGLKLGFRTMRVLEGVESTTVGVGWSTSTVFGTSVRTKEGKRFLNIGQIVV